MDRLTPMPLCRPLAVLACITVALASTGASAQVADVDRATARALSAEGHEALDRKDYAVAADRFARADGLVHAPTLLLGLARAQVGLGKLVAAQETYNRIVREGAPPKAPQVFFKAIEEARKEVDALGPRVPYVIIEVKGPSAPKVTADGVVVPSLALGVKRPLDPGVHVIAATAAGYAPAEVTVTIPEAKVETVTLEMKPEEARPVRPPEATAPPPGKAARPAPREGSTQKTVGIAALAVGGAGLALGGVTGALAVSKHGALLERCTLADGRCPPAAKPELESYTTVGTLSTLGFIAGGAAATAGLVLILTAPASKPREEAALSPVLGFGYVGLRGMFQ